MPLFEHIQDLIAKAKLTEALKVLTDAAEGQDLQNQLTLLSARLNKLTKEDRLGLLSSSDAQVERNRIILALLELAKEVEDEIKRVDIPKMAGAEPEALGIHEFFELIDDSKPLPTPAISALKGYLLRSIPDKMQLNNLHRCLLRIAYDKDSLLQDLEEDTPDIVIREGIRVSEKMQVELIGGDAFEITPLTEKEQILEAGFPTQWDFDVRPKKLGVFPLNFKVAIILPNGRKEIVLTEKVDVVTEAVEAGMEVVVADLEKLKDRGGVYTDDGEDAEAIVERYTTLNDNAARNQLTTNDETRRGKPMILMTFAANDLKGVNSEASKIWETISKQPDIFAQKLENADVEKLAETVVGSENMFMFHFGGHADTKGIVLDGFKHLDKIRLSRILLPDHHKVQIVFLNACQSYGQVGLFLAKKVKAVIATNYKVNDREALKLAELFYKAFFNKHSLADAFQAAAAVTSGLVPFTTTVGPGELADDSPMPSNWSLFVHKGFVEVQNWKLSDFLSQQ